jgi:formate hydrogenlyase subunit 4
VLQTVIDRLKLLNKPSAVNNKNSFIFLVVMLIMSYIANYYILIVIILRGIMLIFIGVMVGNNIYRKMRAYRIVVLSWRYDIILLVILLSLPKEMVIIIVLYYLLSCEVRRTPIDLIERESELVSGFNTEYSGREFVRFFLGEYLRILIFLVMVMSADLILLIILYIIVMYVRRSYPRKKYTEVVLSI